MPVTTIEKADGVAVLTMNRPESRNAINVELSQAIADALDDIEADASVTVTVLAGAGGTFCAGLDLKAFAEGEWPEIPGRGLAGLTEWEERTKPIIAAVEGWALAGGFELALSCDLIVAASDSRFGLPEVKRGLVAAGGGLLRLPRTLPYQLAMELALTGNPLTADRAYHHGMVNAVAEPGGATAAAVELARVIAANGPLGLAASRTIINHVTGWTDAEEFAWQLAITQPVFDSADAIEGATAFAEKRAPRWTGA
ncbi:crotonase/enoyl-CoA hydratase family protein [Aeromicrobium ginsengisoli]|uniref:Crotonase/enoyl-CoA hydratase family protein n=1 Tax=Aeromicrobium ginsengisoli TaxID=363867 RepID=A0A5M4F934_9ACTN|nr:crotonase/enoyl-CoA hydratase family protein [Aeromicrobium ginsengisoli]KAA1394287.1 crotonase/enoyl-CoA hydratase family protein [Aeromicrobium ginsengisoli]